MALDWDIKLDDVSIKEQISQFTLIEGKSSYVKELTLQSPDPDFFDQFTYTSLPTARIEVFIKSGVDFVSYGKFYIEKPVMVLSLDSTTSPGVWGRSETAKAGEPFASKLFKSWDSDTTFTDIVTEVSDLVGMTTNIEIENYSIPGNAYIVNGKYPIDIIAELAEFAGAYVSSNAAGELVIKQDDFHFSTEDHTIDDSLITSVNKTVDLPDFGNRIRISAVGGSESGYSVSLKPLNDADCLPADGTSKGVLLAFVTDPENEPAPDNTMVSWEIGQGAVLNYVDTATGDYLLSNKKHKATNFYTVSVEFPIKEIIGIWAYSDSGNSINFWEEEYGSFLGSEITVRTPFKYCDQSLRITYITSGCAVNIVTAGDTAKDVEVTADVEGVTSSIEVKLGNTCACGSSLNAKIAPPDSICLGNLAHILVWATISKIPATGSKVEVRLTSGCGELSSENKIFKNVEVLDEASYVENVIEGTSQVSTEIDISSAQLPYVYLESDTGKTNNLYSSFEGKIIDLDTVLTTGEKVLITYHAEGATVISWRTLGATNDCDAEVTATMSDGTEAGLRTEINLRAIDCTVSTTPPDSNEDYSEYDPVSFGGGSGDGGGFEDDGNHETGAPEGYGEGGGDPCLPTVMDRILNIDTATNDDERDAIRFGVKSQADCPEDGEFDCPCSELCHSEVMADGNTLDKEVTIHDETIAAGFEKGTPEYNEEFQRVMDENIASCSDDCEANRLLACGTCDTVTGPEQLAPGESAEYTCSNGVSKIITMPEGHCGVYTASVGCCSVDIRSTVGHWVGVDPIGCSPMNKPSCNWGSGWWRTCSETNASLTTACNRCNNIQSHVGPIVCGNPCPPDFNYINVHYCTQEWQCY